MMFVAVDYVIFICSILLCLCIGIIFAYRRRKQNTTEEYLLGSRKLHAFPVALSVVVSFQSAITMVGLPADTYMHGMVVVWIAVSTLFSFLFAMQILVPLVHPLKITSIYEYFQLRFRSSVPRLYATVLGILFTILYLAAITYGSATAVEAVTPFPLWTSILVSTVIAIIYTSINQVSMSPQKTLFEKGENNVAYILGCLKSYLGGMRAVIWTDVFQMVVMTVGTIAVLIKCSLIVGGAGKVFEVAAENGRLNAFKSNSFLYGRTFWTVLIGNFFFGLGFTLNQMLSQRVSSVRTQREARCVIVIAGFTLATNMTLACLVGVFAFAYFQQIGCDPLAGKLISNSNQIIPIMVTQIFRDVPGIPGLYIAALYSATLSTLSSGLNSLSALTIQDIVKPYVKNITEVRRTIIAKAVVVVYGIIVIAFSFMIAKMKGSLIQVVMSILSSFSGSVVGMLLLAVFVPMSNKTGIMIGGLVGASLILWISIGQNLSTTLHKEQELPSASTAQCWLYTNQTTGNSTFHYEQTANSTEYPVSEIGNTGLDRLYSVSHRMLQFIGIFTTIIIGTVVSLCTGPTSPENTDVTLVLPFLDQFLPCLPEKIRRFCYCGVEFEKDFVKTFNFHNYDNVKHTPTKLDPRKQKSEVKAMDVVNLLFSAYNGDVTAMRSYMSLLYALLGLDMNQCDYDGRTALHIAAAEGHLSVTTFLLSKCNSNPFAKDRWGFQPIDDARRFGHILNSNRWGFQPIDDARRFGHKEVEEILQFRMEKKKQQNDESTSESLQ